MLVSRVKFEGVFAGSVAMGERKAIAGAKSSATCLFACATTFVVSRGPPNLDGV